MQKAAHGRLITHSATVAWFFKPLGNVNDTGRGFLLGQLLNAPLAALMGSFCALMVLATAYLRTAHFFFGVLIVVELALAAARFLEWRWRQAHLRAHSGYLPAIDLSALLSLLWCTLQGLSTYIIMSSGDSVLRVLSATLVMALIGPICSRNYAAPRFAFLLVLLLDLPFVAGAIASHDPWLLVLVVMTPPFLIGAMQIIVSFHRALLLSLEAQARNLHLAQHDSLTGILNRHGMDTALSRIKPDAQRKMALMAIDLDGFKQVNDSYGHGAGDLLLIKVAQRIQALVSGENLLGRMGGDEFMVVMRDVSPAQVGPFAEALIAAISHRPYELHGGMMARIGASIGYACLPEDAATAAELRLRADQALYKAKEAGKGIGVRYRDKLGNVSTALSCAGEARSGFHRLQPQRVAPR
jgi:diguanylate cyclase (GGDEF)-like protein